MRHDVVSVPRWHQVSIALMIITALLTALLVAPAQSQAQTAKHILTFTPTPLVAATTGSITSAINAPRIVLQTVDIPAILNAGVPFAIDATWSANGVPLDSQWKVVYQLRTNDTSVTTELISETDLSNTLQTNVPSITDTFWLTTTVSPGVYTISMLVRDAAGKRSPLTLAIAGVQPDGSYPLGSIEVQAGTTAAASGASYKMYLPISMTAANRTTIAPGGNTRPVFINPARMNAIRNVIAQRTPNSNAYSNDLLGECRNALVAGEHAPSVIYVPGYYIDQAGHANAKEAIKIDANNVYALGLCYRISDDDRYAQAAATIIKAWASNVKEIKTDDDTTLVLSYHFPAMIFGADLIRSSSAYKAVDKEFTAFLQQKMVYGSSIDRVSRAGCGYTASGQPSNNWSDWGTVLTISIGAFTNDPALVNKAVEKWKTNIAFQVDKDGNLPMEGRRNNCTGEAGIGYTNFAMQALSLTAEIANNNGIDLFHYTVNGDNPYLRAWNRTAHVVRFPSTFTFSTWNDADYPTFRYDMAWFEIANTYFPNEDAAWVLAKFRPVVSREVFRFGTVTHGALRVNLSASPSSYSANESVRQDGDASSNSETIPAPVDEGSTRYWSATDDDQ